MNRFRLTRKMPNLHLRFLFQLLIFIVVIFVLMHNIASIRTTTEANQIDSLRRAITRSAVQCYALEGFYPESLAYLEDHYGISWNHDKYIVDYEIIGSNLMPDVTVFPLKSKGAS